MITVLVLSARSDFKRRRRRKETRLLEILVEDCSRYYI